MAQHHIGVVDGETRWAWSPACGWLGRIVLAAAIAGMAGCTNRSQPQAMQEPLPEPPRLAHESPVSLYASLDGGEDVPVRARSATSLMQHTFTEEGADGDPDIAGDGQRMVFHSSRHSLQADLYLKLINGKAVTQLTGNPASDVQPAFGPRGDRVAFASDRTGNWDIWVMGIEGRKATQITRGEANEVHPSWSSQGDRIVFCSQSPRSGQWELWIADAEGKSSPRFIADGAFPQWHPSNDIIVYQRAKARGSRRFSIWTIELVDGEPQYPTEVAADGERAFVTPTWSPQGDRIAFAAVLEVTKTVEGNDPEKPKEQYVVQEADLWVVDADGGGRMRLTDEVGNDFSPAWSPDGRIFFVSDRQGAENIWSVQPVSPALPSAPSVENGPPARVSVNQPSVPTAHIGPPEEAK